MDRRGFLTTACVGATLSSINGDGNAQEVRTKLDAERGRRLLTVRPYELLCVVCSIGEEGSARPDGPVNRIRQAVREHPDMPITIVCNAGDVYLYQDPGTEDDTPEGADFNRKRDLDILQRMNWAPGITLPARMAFGALVKHVPSVSGICGYDIVTADGWKGCANAKRGFYEKGLKKGINAIIPPRGEEEMEREKQRSVKALLAAEEVTIRPHILLCAVCQYGGGVRPPFKPDNLPDLLQLILTAKPEIRITMARSADWMMCAPCPARVPELNACVNVLGSGGLSNEKRDLDMLQVLGLQFGSSMGARDLLRLIFERIPTTQDICKREGSVSPSAWWDGCGESNITKGNENYGKGRRELMAELGIA